MKTTQERLARYLGQKPQIHPSAYVHPTAVLLGDVRIGPQVTILPQVVLRADIHFIEIGAFSNIQDGTVVHLSDDYPVRIGEWVTVGHGALIHACTVEDGSLIGMRATLLDGCVIGRESIIGACTLVTKKSIIPSRSMMMGVPGKVVRAVSEEEVRYSRHLAEKYLEVGKALARLSHSPCENAQGVQVSDLLRERAAQEEVN